MSTRSGLDEIRPPPGSLAAVLGWSLVTLVFAVPVVIESLALERADASDRSAGLVLLSLAVAGSGFLLLAIGWRRIVQGVGNEGLATIASIAGMQFIVAYAARLVGSITGAVLGPMYVFVDGLGSKGLNGLFLGVLVALLPRPGALALALLTLFTLNAITSGQVGLVAIVFVAVSVALHEGLAALLGVTTGDSTRVSTGGAKWSFAIRAGLAIGVAYALSLYAQYALYEVLLRLYFDTWYKLAVSIVTGLIYGGIGAGCGALLGLRLRRMAP